MKIIYKNQTVERQFEPQHKNKWRYPSQVTVRILAAWKFITEAYSLNDVMTYRPFHFHQMKGRRKGEWSIYLGNTGYRVTMIPCREDLSEILSGDILAESYAIKIIEVTEVSNHYE